MKNPKRFFNDLTFMGKCFSWLIMPVYYITHLILGAVGIILYGVFAVIQEIKGDY